MNKIEQYKSFNEKESKFFPIKKNPFWIIKTIGEFEEWYDVLFKQRIHSTNLFRGLSQAKYKLYNNSQRYWIEKNLLNWTYSKLSYVEMLKINNLIKTVFNLHGLFYKQWDFPILSILQHYGAPTPLMDWTYDFNVALFFASESINEHGDSDNINDYFSVYHIVKKEQNRDTVQKGDQLMHILDWNNDKYPTIEKFTEKENSTNFLLYISDQGNKNILSYYNHNIVPQRGVFIFTPLPYKPLEDCFSSIEEQRDFYLIPFRCYNIHKSLAEYVRRKLKKERGIDRDFLFPKLDNVAKNIVDNFLDGLYTNKNN